MRLRQKSLEDVEFQKLLEPDKDLEGNSIPNYSTKISIKAEIWSAKSELQLAMYGQRIARIQNMLYIGSENIQEGDLVTYEGEVYKVISRKGKSPQRVEIEKVI